MALRASAAFSLVGGALRFSQSQYREWRLRQLMVMKAEEQQQQHHHHKLNNTGEKGQGQQHLQQQHLHQQNLQQQQLPHEEKQQLKQAVQREQESHSRSQEHTHGEGQDPQLHQRHQQLEPATGAGAGTWWALDFLWRSSPAVSTTARTSEVCETSNRTVAAAAVPDTRVGSAGQRSERGSVGGREPAGGETSTSASTIGMSGVRGSSAETNNSGSATSSAWQWPEWLPVRQVSEEELNRREEERMRMVRALKARSDRS